LHCIAKKSEKLYVFISLSIICFVFS
jgi:hypothetical protein